MQRPHVGRLQAPTRPPPRRAPRVTAASLRYTAACVVVAALVSGVGRARADVLPSCTANAACIITGTVTATTSTTYTHTAPVTIAEGGKVECLADFCTLDFAVADMTVAGTVRAPILQVVSTAKVTIDGGAFDARALGNHAELGSGRGKSATSMPGSGASYGGAGVDACDTGSPPTAGAVYGDATAVSGFLGSGGGNGRDTDGLVKSQAGTLHAGGRGGGIIDITAASIEFRRGGRVDAGGGDGTNVAFEIDGGGGGSGGTAILRISGAFVESVGGGTISVRGGHSTQKNEVPGSKSGAGGGGRVFILADTSTVPVNVELRTEGGGSACGTGGDGSAMVKVGHQQCVRQGGAATFTCGCDAGFTGARCDTCATGFFGPSCSHACPNCGAHGSCSHKTSGSGCDCDVGWGQDRCDNCTHEYYGPSCQRCVWCGEHAHCLHGLSGSGACECDVGWAGNGCADCAAGYYGALCDGVCPACGAHGTCSDGHSGTGACVCATGWAGALCDKCAPGYHGPTCSGPCPDCGEHATCVDGLSGSGCECEAGWRRPSPGALCTECVDGRHGPLCNATCPACVAGQGACDDGVAGTGLCVCNATYFGPLCAGACPDCGTNGTCADGRAGSGACVCAAGFNGTLCDRCADGFYGPVCASQCGDCGDHATCQDGRAGAGCVCAQHWRVPDGGGSSLCTECAKGRWGPTCAACPDCGANGTCVDGAAGSGECSCDAGFYGRLCGSPCPACANGTCADGAGGTGDCVCATGWDGALCDVCASTYYGLDCSKRCPFCGAHASCSDGLRGGGCVCDVGWARTTPGGLCDRCDVGYYGAACKPCPACGSHGRCDETLSGTGKCACDTGWAGQACAECRTGFFGPDCDGECPDCGTTRACDDGPAGTGTCVCTGGWSGAGCDVCPPNWAGALCDACAPGHYGPLCARCACADAPESVCDDGIGGSGNCTCAAGFTGPACAECGVDGDGTRRYGPLCLKCPACAPGAACEAGVTGTGACICTSGGGGGTVPGALPYDGEQCVLVSPDDWCASDAEGDANAALASSPGGGTKCLPGTRTLQRGFDAATGALARYRVFAAGLGTGAGGGGGVPSVGATVGGTAYAAPVHATLAPLDVGVVGDGVMVSRPIPTWASEAAAASPDGAVTDELDVSVVGTLDDAREWLLEGRLGARAAPVRPGQSSRTSEGGAAALPGGSLGASASLADAAAALRASQFFAFGGRRRLLYRLENDYTPLPSSPPVAAAVVGAVGGGLGVADTSTQGSADTEANLRARFTSRDAMAALVGRGVGSGVGGGGNTGYGGTPPGLRLSVGFRKALAALPRGALPSLRTLTDCRGANPTTLDGAAAASHEWAAYAAFIADYGTHYVRGVDVGGMLEARADATLCPSFAVLRVNGNAKAALRAEVEGALASASRDTATGAAAGAGGGSVSDAAPGGALLGTPAPRVRDLQGMYAGARLQRRRWGGTATAFATGGYGAWLASVPTKPAVVGLQLAALSSVVPSDDGHVAANLDQAVALHVASADAQLLSTHAGIVGLGAGAGAAVSPAVARAAGRAVLPSNSSGTICLPQVERGTLFFVSGAGAGATATGGAGSLASLAALVAAVAVALRRGMA